LAKVILERFKRQVDAFHTYKLPT